MSPSAACHADQAPRSGVGRFRAPSVREELSVRYVVLEGETKLGGKRLRVSDGLTRLVDRMRGFESPCNSKQHSAQVAKDELAGEEEEAARRTRRCL